MGRQPRGRFGMIDRDRMNRAAAALFEQLGVPMDPERQALGMSIADQQVVEIAKAISLDARVLIMDEPTAALSGAERSEEHTSELQSRENLVCRLLLEKKKLAW